MRPGLSGSRKAVLTVLGAVYGGVDHPLLGSDVMEVFFLMLAVIAGVGVAVFLFVIEPRRKIYDYDPHDPRQWGKGAKNNPATHPGEVCRT
jgi:hypothetical protein